MKKARKEAVRIIAAKYFTHMVVNWSPWRPASDTAILIDPGSFLHRLDSIKNLVKRSETHAIYGLIKISLERPLTANI
jgi:hypothetical protein